MRKDSHECILEKSELKVKQDYYNMLPALENRAS